MSYQPSPDTLWLVAAKSIGAVAGSAISLAYVLPKGRREAALRFLTGMVAGLAFGGPAGLKIVDHLQIGAGLSGFEIALTGAAATSLCAWSALGVLTRLADRHAARK